MIQLPHPRRLRLAALALGAGSQTFLKSRLLAADSLDSAGKMVPAMPPRPQVPDGVRR